MALPQLGPRLMISKLARASYITTCSTEDALVDGVLRTAETIWCATADADALRKAAPTGCEIRAVDGARPGAMNFHSSRHPTGDE